MRSHPSNVVQYSGNSELLDFAMWSQAPPSNHPWYTLFPLFHTQNILSSPECSRVSFKRFTHVPAWLSCVVATDSDECLDAWTWVNCGCQRPWIAAVSLRLLRSSSLRWRWCRGYQAFPQLAALTCPAACPHTKNRSFTLTHMTLVHLAARSSGHLPSSLPVCTCKNKPAPHCDITHKRLLMVAASKKHAELRYKQVAG